MVEDLIRRARQRYLLNAALAQTAFAAAAVIAGFVLMLVLGTRYLGWWTMALFAAAGIAVGIFRVYRQTPDTYATAIRLDENARLQDALSTALYFSGHPEGAAEGFRRSQRQQAEARAGGVTLDRAVPFIIPRSVYAMAALALLASGLVAWRYHLGLGLDLRSPIAQALLQKQAVDNPKQEAKKTDPKQLMQEAQALLARLGVKSDGLAPPEDQDEINKALDQALQANPAPKDQKGDKKSAEDTKESSDSGDPMDLVQDQKDESLPGTEDAGGNKMNPGQQESVLSKLKQAVSSLLSKSKLKESNPSDSNKDQQAQSDAKMSGEQGNAGKDQPEQGESMSDALQGDANSQSKAGQKGKLDSNDDPKGQGSGIGNQNGLKEQREAEQLKAMGKISEIIGKRATTVSGEMMVEVQSGKNQQLRTAYTSTTAAHGEADGDVTRDEIPLSLQPYVQQYFEQVRKAAPQSAAPPK
jgi:hypothetical protein